MEMKYQSNLQRMITNNNNGTFNFIDSNIDVTIIDNEKVSIYGKGKRGLTSYIRGCFEEYKKELKEFKRLSHNIEIILNNIITLSKNTIEFSDVAVYKEDGMYKCFVSIAKYSNELQYNETIGYIIIDANTYEVLEVSKRKRTKEQLNKFISSYNRYISGDDTESVEVVTLESIKTNISNVENEINTLEAKYNDIKVSRINKGYSMAIYKCNDTEAIELIQIDKQIKELEKKEDDMQKDYNKLFYDNYKIESLAMHDKFNNARYEIMYNKDNDNRIYTNDIEYYKKKAIDENKDISINEYIDFNNTINKDVNKPVLKTIYEYDSNNKIFFNAIPHQLNYANYKEVYTDDKGNILQLIEKGYTDKNIEIYTKIVNAYGDEIVSIHKPYSSRSYLSITKFKNNENFYTTGKAYFLRKEKELNIEQQELILNCLKKLENNNNYKYDIPYIKNFMFN